MKTFAIALSLAAALGCTSTRPTRELVDARHAYEVARRSPDARRTPGRVLEAQRALERAEYAHRENPGSFRERSLAYVAERRSELAVVYGAYERERRRREAADAAYAAREAELRQKAELNDAETRRALESVNVEQEKSP